MQKINCTNCGNELTTDTVCPDCGHITRADTSGQPEPSPPPEVATWHIERATSDVLAWATQTFNEAEFLAAKREIEQGGGVQLDDLIAEIERKIHGNH